MPKGPQGQKRPADAIGNAVHIAKIATGELEETTLKQPAKRKSGLAGAKVMSAEYHRCPAFGDRAQGLSGEVGICIT